MIVLDSSVALKWIFADEEGATRAYALRDTHVSGINTLAVPTLFFYEIANVLATKVKISAEQAREAFELFCAFEFDVHELDRDEYLAAMDLAQHYKISVYDACYHVLAKRLECRFVTADRRFWDKVKDQGVVDLL